MKQSKLFIASFVANILVFLFVLVGTILMFVVHAKALASNTLEVAKYFTFQSNIFMGIVAFIYGFYQVLIFKGKKKEIPSVLRVFNFVGVVALSITFTVVIIFLGPLYGYPIMYNGANLFYHALAPLMAMINFMFLEKEGQIKFKETFFGVVPLFLYGIVYLSVVVALKAYGDLKIDFYGFGAQGPGWGLFYFVILLHLAYGLGFLMYFINRCIFKKSR